MHCVLPNKAFAGFPVYCGYSWAAPPPSSLTLSLIITLKPHLKPKTKSVSLTLSLSLSLRLIQTKSSQAFLSTVVIPEPTSPSPA